MSLGLDPDGFVAEDECGFTAEPLRLPLACCRRPALYRVESSKSSAVFSACEEHAQYARTRPWVTRVWSAPRDRR